MERERLGSRLGFILLSAGCAIGCGNVWKFPWMCGQYGGGGFVLIYILCLLLLGLPVMTMEFAVGRAAQASPIHMYQKLEKKGQKWHIHGYVSLFGSIALMAFYTVVTGWIVYYFVQLLAFHIVSPSAFLFTLVWSYPIKYSALRQEMIKFSQCFPCFPFPGCLTSLN